MADYQWVAPPKKKSTKYVQVEIIFEFDTGLFRRRRRQMQMMLIIKTKPATAAVISPTRVEVRMWWFGAEYPSNVAVGSAIVTVELADNPMKYGSVLTIK